MGMAVKWGAGWVNVNPGKLAIKWGGNSWFLPSKCRAKIGDTGGGYWLDTNYVSYPNPPTSLGISSWSYTHVTFTWAGPAAGGAPPSYYQIIQWDGTGGGMITYVNTTAGTATFSVSQDRQYRFTITTVAASGLQSSTVGPLYVLIGHPQVNAQRYAQRSVARQWEGHISIGQGHVAGASAPALNTGTYGFAVGAFITDMHLNIYTDFSSVLQSGTRSANWLANGDAPNLAPNIALPFAGWVDFYGRNNWSNGGAWGLYVYGSGWGTTNSYYFLKGVITIAGTEYYAVVEDYVAVGATGNQAWW